VFVPQREHSRFCSGDCQAAWNCEHLGDPEVEASTLNRSMAAMSEATARLPAVKVRDRPGAFAAIGEAVWWITMVDSTLVRHYPGAYDVVMAAHTPSRAPFDRRDLGRVAVCPELDQSGSRPG
jgi:hypothetical protein